MVKKKVEIEVEYPDCISCGQGIFDGERFYEVATSLSLMTMSVNLIKLKKELEELGYDAAHRAAIIQAVIRTSKQVDGVG